MSTKSEPSRGGWLPVELALGAGAALAADAAVRWMEFGSAALTEPFLDHTIFRLRETSPAAREWDTGLEAILRSASDLPQVKPAGFVFHISRCGSTLVANALKTAAGTQVVSESRAITKLLWPDDGATSAYLRERWNQRRGALLHALFSLFAHHPRGQLQKLVIKMVSVNLLSMRVVREFWPDVPCVVVVRDPAEVIVATLQSGGGWLAFKETPEIADGTFRFPDKSASNMAAEEYCARVLGQFMTSALDTPAEGCMVVDYEDLNERRMREIAHFFGLELPPDTQRLEPVFSYYAKDPAVRQKFEDDRAKKRALVTPEIRSASNQWAMPAYCDLRAR